MGTLNLKTSFFPLAFILFFFPAKASIDGAPAQKVGWGQTQIPLPAGQHQVRVFFPYLFPREAGAATIAVTVAEGQAVSLTYRAPWLVFLPGKLKQV